MDKFMQNLLTMLMLHTICYTEKHLHKEHQNEISSPKKILSVPYHFPT